MTRWSHAFIAGIGNLADDADIWARCDAAQAEVDALLDELDPALPRAPGRLADSAWSTRGCPTGRSAPTSSSPSPAA